MKEFAEQLQSIKTTTILNNLTWKTRKGESIKLMEAEESDLRKWFKHCDDMLNNTNPWHPGKYVIRQNIQRILSACRAELLCRYLLTWAESGVKNKCELLMKISDAQLEVVDPEVTSASVLFPGISDEFSSVTVTDLIDASLDKLGILNRKLISDKFIISQGLWFTDEERGSEIPERLSGIKTTPTGLSLKQLNTILDIGPRTKFSDLTTPALMWIADLIIPRLDYDLNYHIKKWSVLMDNLTRAAEARNLVLTVS